MALIDDIAAQMGTSTTAWTEVQQARIELAVADATAIIGDLVDLSQVPADKVERVIRWAVAEWASLPASGVIQKDTSVDDARTAVRWSAEAARSLRAVLAGYLDELLPAAGGGAFTIRPAYEPDTRWRRDAWW